MSLIKRAADCGTIGDDYKDRGLWADWRTTPKRGWVVIFDFAGKHDFKQHIGIVESVNADGSLVTIEGNTGSGDDANGGAVMRRERSTRDVVGYGMVPYASDAEREAKIELAVAQIGVTEWPKNSNNVLYNDWYYGYHLTGDNSDWAPWCCTFVCWVLLSGEESDSGGTSSAEDDEPMYDLGMRRPLLMYGASGPWTKMWQKLLLLHGYSLGKYGDDGEYGSETVNATVEFQTDHGLDPDGQAGPLSWKAAYDAL